MDETTNPTPENPELTLLKKRAEQLAAERRTYVEKLAPPLSPEEQRQLAGINQLSLDALASYFEARDKQ